MFGFGVLILLIAVSSFNSIWHIKGINQKAQNIGNLRLPTAQASSSILNGVNHALAALRGWMILGKDKFKEERETAWGTEINNALVALEDMSDNWTNPENVTRLVQLKLLLKELASEQQQIEDIAQTPQNIPSLEMLYEQAVPQASVMGKQITLMIDLEAKLEATPERKALLGMMADVRGTLGLGIASLRGYLLSGEAKFKDNFETLWAKNDRRFSDLRKNQNLLSYQQAKAFKLFEQARAIFSPLPPFMLSMRGREDWNIANHWLDTKADPIGSQIKVILQEMADNQAILLADDTLTMTKRAEKAEIISWLQLLLGLVFGVLAYKFVTKSIVGPIDNLKKAITQSQKDSDLTVRSDVSGQDEVTDIARAFNDMMKAFQQTLNNVTDASHQIASASEETSIITEQTSAAVKRQQGETTQLSLAMNEMSLTVNDIAKNTTQTSSASDEAIEHVNIGLKGMQGTISTVNNLASVIERAEQNILDLERRTVDISSVLDVISGVAEQTNLLALNAAIEAARAGEHGRGFAVVADEVRTLASRTQKSTGEITSIIDHLQREAKQAVLSMKESQTEVANAVSQADEAGESLNTIADVIHRINDMSIQIATAAEEQGAVAIEVSRNVESINMTAEQTADAATQTSKSSHDLAELASGLNNLVHRFKVA